MGNLFLATVIGWYLVVFSILVLCKQEYVKSVSTDIMANNGLFFIMAVITFILGLLLVTSHNVWVMSWPVIITIFGWMVLAGSIIRLFFPEMVHTMWKSLFNNRIALNIMGVVTLVIGLYLLYHAYAVHF